MHVYMYMSFHVTYNSFFNRMLFILFVLILYLSNHTYFPPVSLSYLSYFTQLNLNTLIKWMISILTVQFNLCASWLMQLCLNSYYQLYDILYVCHKPSSLLAFQFLTSNLNDSLSICQNYLYVISHILFLKCFLIAFSLFISMMIFTFFIFLLV